MPQDRHETRSGTLDDGLSTWTAKQRIVDLYRRDADDDPMPCIKLKGVHMQTAWSTLGLSATQLPGMNELGPRPWLLTSDMNRVQEPPFDQHNIRNGCGYPQILF